MAIRLSGELPIQEIATEFGGEAAPNPLSDYYADGTYLAAGYYPTSPAVPSKGSSLNIGAFYGKQKKESIFRYIANDRPFGVDVAQLFNLADRQSTIGKDFYVVINSGVTVHQKHSGEENMDVEPALNVYGFSSPHTLTIINNGNIIGASGPGGEGGQFIGSFGGGGGRAYPAISVSSKVTIINNGIIAGGGKGGRGGNAGSQTGTYNCSPTVTCAGCRSTTTCDDPRQSATTCAMALAAGTCSQAYQNQRTPNGNGCNTGCRGNDPCRNGCMNNCPCGTCRDGNTPDCRQKNRDGCWSCCIQTFTTCYTPYCNNERYTTTYTGTCTTTVPLRGGNGGAGASPFSNTVIKGGSGEGGNAQNGEDGSLWGAAASITGYANVLNAVGGTIHGAFVN
jgi:hypothetical protein